MYKILAVCFLFLFSGCVEAQSVDTNKTRAFVATRLAQSLMVGGINTPNTPDTPDTPNEELCDGSGFIVHGDGHRTPCPGCKACKKKEENGQDAIAESPEPEYYIYHFGARWCGPCERMKQSTWKDEELKTFLQEKNVQLIIFDQEDTQNKQFFSYYNIRLFPTIMVVKVDELDKVLSKREGYLNADGIRTMIEGLKINE